MAATEPSNIDPSATKQSRLYGAYIVTYCLAVIAVGLRLFCRKGLSKAGLWWDDYLICSSLVFAGGNFVDMLIWVYRGVGTHIALYAPETVMHFFLNLFICEILYTVVLCLTKWSILLFYWRIFGKANVRIPVLVIGSIVTSWGIAVVATTIFQCTPIRGFWDFTISSSCTVNVYAFFIGNAVPNIITDWALLILPIPYIWRLHQSRVQKVALCGIFLLGGFICIISIIRLYVMIVQLFRHTSTDYTWTFILPSMWTAVEVNIGIVSACLPSLRPILTLFTRDKANCERLDSSGSEGKRSYSRRRVSPVPYDGSRVQTETVVSVCK